MKKDIVAAIVSEIAVATRQPESIVLEAYTQAAATLKSDARIMDYVPLLAARRVREILKTSTGSETTLI
jgi:hypothetical protein